MPGSLLAIISRPDVIDARVVVFKDNCGGGLGRGTLVGLGYRLEGVFFVDRGVFTHGIHLVLPQSTFLLREHLRGEHVAWLLSYPFRCRLPAQSEWQVVVPQSHLRHVLVGPLAQLGVALCLCHVRVFSDRRCLPASVQPRAVILATSRRVPTARGYLS